MRNLNYELKQLCHAVPADSYGTQNNRKCALQAMADRLHKLGFQHMRADSLKPKHVVALVESWKAEGLTTAAIKNSMSHLRWWAGQVNKASVVPRTNADLGIENRKYITNEDKGLVLQKEILDKVKDPFVRMSLELQAAFGLRREEAIKIQPDKADRGETLHLSASWCKGGLDRDVAIRTAHQRDVLARAKVLASQTPKKSLVPYRGKGTDYCQQKNLFERETRAAGISRTHGLRHRYAQERYRELTGRECPARGGVPRKELTFGQSLADEDARRTITKELGHDRRDITSIYLGR